MPQRFNNRAELPDERPEAPRVSIAFIMATLGRPEAIKHAHELLSVCSASDCVVVVSMNEHAVFLREQLDPRVMVVAHSRPGASAARNIGIEVVKSELPSVTHYVFPNDRSQLRTASMTALKGRVQADMDAIVIGSWNITDWGSDHRPGYHRGKVSLTRAIATAYEPAIAIPRAVVESGIRWCEVICPGAQSPWHASDGPDLILTALGSGFSAVVDYGFCVDNVSTSFQLTGRDMKKKYFAYARGAGLVQFRHRATLGPAVVALGTIGPLVGWLLRRPYWRRAGFRHAVAAVFGRFVGMFDGATQQCSLAERRWQLSEESSRPYVVLR